MIRWAILATSGKSYRVYAENRVLAVTMMKQQTGERWAGVIEQAGSVENGIVDRPEWDTVSSEGYPGGPSGRPPSKQKEKKKEVAVAAVPPVAAPVAAAPPKPQTITASTHLPLWRVLEKKQQKHRSRSGRESGLLILVCERGGVRRDAVVHGEMFDRARVGDLVGLQESANLPALR